MPYDGDPDHPIIERPWEYQILLFCYHNDPNDWRESYIHLTLGRGAVVRRLRFLGPPRLGDRAGVFPGADRRDVHPRRPRSPVDRMASVSRISRRCEALLHFGLVRSSIWISGTRMPNIAIQRTRCGAADPGR